MARIRIDQLPVSGTIEGTHEFPAIRDGVTVKLTVQQLRDLITSAIIGDAPDLLNTLDEISGAFGDDPDFLITVQNRVTTLETEIDTKLANNGGTLADRLVVERDNDDAVSALTGSEGSIESRSTGSGAASIKLNRDGTYAIFLGIDTDNELKIGGGSAGTNAFKILHEGLTGDFDTSVEFRPLSRRVNQGEYDDFTASQFVLANGAFIDYPNFSGILFVGNYNGRTEVWICGGGATASLGAVQASSGTLTYNSGVNGYRFTNTTGSSVTYSISAIRLRPNA